MASDLMIRMVLNAGERLYCGCGKAVEGVENPKDEESTVYIDSLGEIVECSPCYLAEGREAEDESSTGLGFNRDGTERFPTPCGHEDAPCCGCHLEMDHGDYEPDFDDNPYDPG